MDRQYIYSVQIGYMIQVISIYRFLYQEEDKTIKDNGVMKKYAFLIP